MGSFMGATLAPRADSFLLPIAQIERPLAASVHEEDAIVLPLCERLLVRLVHLRRAVVHRVVVDYDRVRGERPLLASLGYLDELVVDI